MPPDRRSARHGDAGCYRARVAPPPPPLRRRGDTSSPSAPTGLADERRVRTAATLSWGASTDDVGVVGYGVYVGGIRIGTTSQTSYAFSGLSCASNYTLGVDAYDAAGNRSPVATLIVTTSACARHHARRRRRGRHEPADRADESGQTAVSDSAATLSWSASTDDVGVAGYDLYVGGIGIGTSTQTSYAFSGLTCGTELHARRRCLRRCRQPLLGLDADRHHQCVHRIAAAASAAATGRRRHEPADRAGEPLADGCDHLERHRELDRVDRRRRCDRLRRPGRRHPVRHDGHDLVYGHRAFLRHVTPDSGRRFRRRRQPFASGVRDDDDLRAARRPHPVTRLRPRRRARLRSRGRAQTSISVSWAASSDNVGVAGYGVYSNGTLVGSPTSTSYTVSGLACGTSYSSPSTRSTLPATARPRQRSPPLPPPVPTPRRRPRRVALRS